MRIMQRTLAFNMRLPTHAMPISIFIRNAYADVTRTYPRKIQEWASNWWEPGKETMHDGSDGGFGGDGKKSLAPSQPTPWPPSAALRTRYRDRVCQRADAYPYLGIQMPIGTLGGSGGSREPGLMLGPECPEDPAKQALLAAGRPA